MLELFKASKKAGLIRKFIAPPPCPKATIKHLSSHGKLLIRDPKEVREKVTEIAKMGHDHLQILTDFDMTLTKAGHIDGRSADSSFKALQDSVFIPQHAKMQNRKLYDHYHPIEMDPNISQEEKGKQMQDWWEGTMTIFSSIGLQRADYARVVLESRLLFRHGVNDLLSLASKLRLPLFIVSGGLAEIIQASFYAIMHNGETEEEIFEYWHQHVQVLSNQFEFVEDRGVGYQTPLIHILNKRAFIYDENAKRSFRKNTIVMGDIIEDVKMVNHEKHDIVLKIGFFNNTAKEAHLLEDF